MDGIDGIVDGVVDGIGDELPEAEGGAHAKNGKSGLRKVGQEIAEEIGEVGTKGVGNAWRNFRDNIRTKPNLTRIVWARVLAEGVAVLGAAVAAGVVGETMLNKPYDATKKKFSKGVVEPNLEKIDGWLGYAKSFDPPDEREERQQLPEDQQAKKITDFFVDNYGLKALGAIGGQYVGQKVFTKAFKVHVPDAGNMASIVGDRAAGLGAIYFLNTAGSKQSVDAQRSLESVLMKAGFEENKAEEWASYAVNMQVPNFVGLLASIGILKAVAR